MVEKNKLNLFLTLVLLISIIGCTSSEDRAEEFYEKGMSLLSKDPKQAEKAFKNALAMKNNMVKAMYGLALVAERQGDLKEAYSLAGEVLDEDPNNIEALIKTGQISLLDEKVDLALIRCNKVLELDKNNIAALNLRAALQLKLYDAKGAVDYAKLVLLQEPANEDANLILARERLLGNDDAKAIEYFDKALIVNDKNLTIQLIRIVALENILKTQEADKSYQDITHLLPDSILAKKCYIYFLLKHGRTDDVERQLRVISQYAPPKAVQSKLDVVKFVTNIKGAETGQAELEKFVKNEPENYGLAFVLLNLYRAQNESVKEDALLNEIVKKADMTADGYRARGLMAEKLIRLGKRTEAVESLNNILKKDKRNSQALTLKASLALEDKDNEGAIAYLRIVVSESPKSSSAALMLANAYEKSNSILLAEEQYKNAFVSSNFSSTYGLPYAEFLLRLKQQKSADKVLKEIDKISADVTVAGNTIQQNQIYAAISSSKNDSDGSLGSYLTANEADSGDLRPIIEIAKIYMQMGKNQEALDFIKKVLINNQLNVSIGLLKANIYAAMGETSKAIQITSDIIKSQAKNSIPYQQLASTQLSLNLNTDARETVDQGLSFYPNDFELKLIKARIYEVSGRYEDAILLYERMLEERPESILVSNSLASLLLDYRNDSASLSRAYELSKISKNNQAPQFLDTYGRISFKLGKLDVAEKVLNSAVVKQPESAVFRYHLAKVYLAKNDRIKAKKVLEGALSYSKNKQFEYKEEVLQLLKTL